ncbi:MAG: insulinase family protein [Deltaproteobacteria bacterium]|nr:insulinase family protein [Deltaproteobacteria bacterium]
MRDFKKIGAVVVFGIAIVFILIFVMTSGKKQKETVTQIERVKAWGSVTIHYYRLQNGLEVLLAVQKEIPVFAYYTYYRVGSRNEEKGKTGLAHFFEHLLFKESKNYKEGEFDRIMEEMGAQTNASTGNDWTNYYEVLPADLLKIEMAIKLESDRMQHMIINEAQVTAEMGVVQNERRLRVDNSVEGKMGELLGDLAYEQHSYKHPVIGWMEDIEKYNVQDCLEFYQRYYAPNNATLILVGNIPVTETLDWIEQYYGSIAPSQIFQKEIPTEPPQRKERKLKIVREDIDVEKALYGFHVPSENHPDIAPLDLLAEILFNGEGSRLYRRMIIEEEIVSDLGAGIEHLKDPGLFQISVAMRKGQPVQKASNRIFAEFENVKKNGVSSAELERAKNRYEMGYYHSLETVSGKARNLGHYHVVRGDYKEALTVFGNYARVTVEDIHRVAKIYFEDSNRNSVLAYPKRKSHR